MDNRTRKAGRPVGEIAIDHEMARVAAAIELVASGGGTRVTVAGLHFGAALLPDAERRAAVHGNVRVRALWPMGDGPVDLVVEKAGDHG